MALPCVVSEIFNVEKYHDLEIRVRGHSSHWKEWVWFPLVFYSNFVHKMHRFWDIRLVTIQWPWNQGYGSLKVIGTDTDRFAIYDFLLTLHSNHGPVSYHFRDIRRFQSKIVKFSHPLLFCVPVEGVPLGIGIPALGDQKSRTMDLRGRQRSLTISSAVWIECTNVTDRRTDRQTDTGPQQRRRLRIASRSKNGVRLHLAEKNLPPLEPRAWGEGVGSQKPSAAL